MIDIFNILENICDVNKYFYTYNKIVNRSYR